MRKIIFGTLILFFPLFLVFPSTVQGQATNSPLVLNELIQKVLIQNPELRSSYEGWRASETRVSQEAALPDPELGLNLMNLPVNSFTLAQEPMTGKQISFMQMFPFPGKLGLKGDIARSACTKRWTT